MWFPISLRYEFTKFQQVLFLSHFQKGDMATRSQQTIDIRPAQNNDVAQVAELGARVFSITFGHSIPLPELQAYLNKSYSIEATTKDLEDPMRNMIVARNQKANIVGFALLTRGTTESCITHLEGTIELQKLYVDPAYHGYGIGKRLANKLEEMAKDQGFRNIWLGVWEENYKAQKVYEKLGYSVIGDHDFTIGEVVQTDLIMCKRV